MIAPRPRAWRNGPPVAGRVSPRGEIQYAERSASKVDVTSGWCSSCGAVVRAEDGLHASDCPDVPDERRAAT